MFFCWKMRLWIKLTRLWMNNLRTIWWRLWESQLLIFTQSSSQLRWCYRCFKKWLLICLIENKQYQLLICLIELMGRFKANALIKTILCILRQCVCSTQAILIMVQLSLCWLKKLVGLMYFGLRFIKLQATLLLGTKLI